LNTHLYEQFKNDVILILDLNDKQDLSEQISSLAWKVSFMPKKERINEILNFIKNKKLDKIIDNKQKIDTLELILSLSHLRRAKYNVI